MDTKTAELPVGKSALQDGLGPQGGLNAEGVIANAVALTAITLA